MEFEMGSEKDPSVKWGVEKKFFGVLQHVVC
jgi:hypothetical protein